MLLKLKKTASDWVTLYADAIRNRLRRDLNLADVTDKAACRANIELIKEVPDHWHDNRYLPIIEQNVSQMQNVLGNFTISINGDVIGTSAKIGTNDYAVAAKNVISTNSKINSTSSNTTMYLALIAGDGVQGLLNNSNLKYVPSSGTLTSNILTSSSINTGTVNADKVYNAVWNDFAEFFPRGEETEAGDIIMLDMDSAQEKYVKAVENKSRCIVGVHSNEFAALIGGEIPPEGEDYLQYNLKKFIPVGLAGRVYVKFIGKSEKGGAVVPSATLGCGRLFDPAIDSRDVIIGYLVESDNNTNLRKLKIKIK